MAALLVSPGDSVALARALERILKDADLRRQLARRARATFETRRAGNRSNSAIRAVHAELGVTP